MIDRLKKYEEIFWLNPHKLKTQDAMTLIKKQFTSVPDLDAIKAADARFKRFAPVFMHLFPETQKNEGIIESELKNISNFQKSITVFVGGMVLGDWQVKLDSHLDISGSIKARGGVYEVITFAEKLALEAGLIDESSDYLPLCSEAAKALFSKYTLIVGSTGNLGLSIGIMGKALGFKVTVHMSEEAKAWKVDLLRDKGAEVITHTSDYSLAVKNGRESAMINPHAYFIDDEHSLILFTGYAVAALRLKEQLDTQGTLVDADHPLCVYLPCGVGGAPGGVAYGLKCLYGDSVRIFLAEPTHAPCMLLGMSTEKYDGISIDAIGLDGKTDADGLAVGRASGFVGQLLAPLIDGIYTVSDEKLYWFLYMLNLSESIKLEPSALAGFYGPIGLFYNTQGFNYLLKEHLLEKIQNATHISWATGGGLVPAEIMKTFIEKGQQTTVDF